MSLTARLQELREFDTALLANTIGFIDPTPVEETYMGGSIRSMTPELGPTVGVAVTCEIDASTPGGVHDMGPFWSQVERIAAMDEPVFWVAKRVGSRPDHECVFGDGMAKNLGAAGCVGMITDGGVRDLAGCRTADFAVYAAQTTIHHGAYRVRSVDQPIEVGGITVSPGDVLHANEEGVIRIPKTCLDELPAAATRMLACEHEMHYALRRTDLTVAEKLQNSKDVFEAYGFAFPKPEEQE